MSTYTYAYDLPLPDGATAHITPCGGAQLTATSVLVELPGVRPFHVHRLEPKAGQPYYQLTGQPGQFATLTGAIAAHLAPLVPPKGVAE